MEGAREVSNQREAMESFVRIFDPEHLGDMSPFLADGVVANHWRWGLREIHGKDALVREYFEPLRAAFPDLRFVLRDVVYGEDTLVLRGEFQATFSNKWIGIEPHGRYVHWRAHDIFEFRNGKIVRIWLANDTLTVARQLGAIPDDGKPW